MESDNISNDGTKNWKGIDKGLLPRSFGKQLFPSLIPSLEHTLLFKIPIGTNNIPEAHPKEYCDTWDDKHVKMPCSRHNLFLVHHNNKSSKKNRWDVITYSLLKPILSSEELEKAITSYNPKYKDKWRFYLLHSFFDECLNEEETEEFFNNLLPKIINLALQLPTLVTKPIPLLKQTHNHSISLSQMQIACLLANAFLCTFPHRNVSNSKSEYSEYPYINFNGFFQLMVNSSANHYLYEKLKCIICYFKKVTSANSVLNGVVTYSRRRLPSGDLPYWLQSTKKLTNLYITSDGTIEDNGDGMLQVDFANKFIGGGVLGHGSVQEEIRFLICPELLVSQLFSEKMLHTEAIIITGVERFSDYSGYANSFEWKGVHLDVTPVDDNNRRYTTIVAIDALYYNDPKNQFKTKNLRRELHKSFAGFSWGQDSECSDVAIATGNWGCGAFRGDCHLKSLLQLMSAAQANRDVAYFTFGDTKLMDSIHSMHIFLKSKNITVGEVSRILIKYYACLETLPYVGVHDYIYDAITNKSWQAFENKGYQSGVFPQYSQNQFLRNNYKAVESNTTKVLQASKTSSTENDQTPEQSHPCSSSTSAESSKPYSSSNLTKSTPEESQASSNSNIVKLTSDEIKCCLSTTFIESPSEESQLSSSLRIIESTPEKLEDETELRHVDSIAIDATDHINKQDVRFLPVNQFRLNNDKERTMCINQQKNSWLQLNDSKKDFQSAIEKSSVTGQLSILKRDREENDGGKRVVKRKISDYFSPKR
ncbi:poly(ADP-ribose) glycohydrolase [Metopolophium dirhodum]|uniref:poly(ADP-ribose) glycohydrolase n=1 Tax=Metopolophium dirhodum TaxID=44670 RepID=UPI00298FD707|nr:poly(ADP-ribose) glycohydrolase [Metopolophium dirhodum]XP_060861432.1 poly(ADP-ribose) glycohydrolase [Metopolophium dirhodum]XP_060861433.1 poly(ADP-ribose) glycohydrolase [Metopolophium dirhodum]